MMFINIGYTMLTYMNTLFPNKSVVFRNTKNRRVELTALEKDREERSKDERKNLKCLR
jgi:hypothetical protein